MRASYTLPNDASDFLPRQVADFGLARSINAAVHNAQHADGIDPDRPHGGRRNTNDESLPARRRTSQGVDKPKPGRTSNEEQLMTAVCGTFQNF